MLAKKNRPGLSRFAPMPPTSAARCRITSGLKSAYSRCASASCVRSYSRRRGTIRFVYPRALSFSMTKLPRNPAPPVMMMRSDFETLISIPSFTTKPRRTRSRCLQFHRPHPATRIWLGGERDRFVPFVASWLTLFRSLVIRHHALALRELEVVVDHHLRQ